MQEIGIDKINYVKANDIHGMAKFITTVVTNPSSFKYSLSEKERWHFSSERQANELHALYQRLI